MTRSGRGRAPSEHRPPAQPLASHTPYSLSVAASGASPPPPKAAPPPAAAAGARHEGPADPATVVSSRRGPICDWCKKCSEYAGRRMRLSCGRRLVGALAAGTNLIYGRAYQDPNPISPRRHLFLGDFGVREWRVRACVAPKFEAKNSIQSACAWSLFFPNYLWKLDSIIKIA
jgi:hypothetical protein